MNVDSIRAFCLSFPDATEKLQWGDALCFKVRTKMFAVIGLDRVRFTFKCTPETFAGLIEREDIHPSPYVGRYHWVTLDRLDALPKNELENLIRESYDMVAAKAPKSARGKAKRAQKSGSGEAKTVRSRTRRRTP